MQINKNTNDIDHSSSYNNPLSLSGMDDDNTPKNGTQGEVVPLKSEEVRDAEGFGEGKDACSSINKGSPTSEINERPLENVNKGPKTHKNRYWF